MTDPPRLLDDPDQLSPEERAALSAGRQDHAPPRVRTALWASLVAQITTSTTTAAATASVLGGSIAKWTVVGVAVVGTAVGANHLLSDGPGSERRTAASATTPVIATSDHNAEGANQELAPNAPHPQIAAPTDHAAPAVGRARASGTSTTAQRAHARSDQPAPAGADHPTKPHDRAIDSSERLAGDHIRSFPLRDEATSAEHSTESSNISASDPTPLQPTEESATHPHAAEIEAVTRARAALRSGDATRARSILVQLERDTPKGVLRQEREALQVEALLALGQREAAQARGARFLQSYPKSPLVPRLQALLAN